MQAKDGSGRTGPLPPGDYRLHVVGETAAAVVVPFTIRGGEVTQLDVPLQPGTVVTFVAKLPTQAPGRRIVEFAVRDGEDRLVADPATRAEDRIATIRIALPPGRYRLAANAEGDAGTARFEVADGVPELRVECALTSPR